MSGNISIQAIAWHYKIWKQSSTLKFADLLAGLILLALVITSFFVFSQIVLLGALTVGGVGKRLAGILLVTIATSLFGTIVS